MEQLQLFSRNSSAKLVFLSQQFSDLTEWCSIVDMALYSLNMSSDKAELVLKRAGEKLKNLFRKGLILTTELFKFDMLFNALGNSSF